MENVISELLNHRLKLMAIYSTMIASGKHSGTHHLLERVDKIDEHIQLAIKQPTPQKEKELTTNREE